MNLEEVQTGKKRRDELDPEMAPAGESFGDEESMPIPLEESAGEAGQSPADAPDAAASGAGEDLLASYRNLEARIGAMERQAEEYRAVLEKMGLDTRMLRQKADVDGFLLQMRESFDKDPVATVNKMVNRTAHELWEAMENRISDAINEHRAFKRLLEDFLNDPQNAGLRPYERELEALIRDRGMYLPEAAKLLREVHGKAGRNSRLRSEAAREIRNRSAVETGGEVGEPIDDDKELDRVLKKSKSLDEMFDGLRKLKL